jgi:hypothetical protein
VAAPDVQDERPGFALLATVVVMLLVGTVVTFGFYSTPAAWPQQTSAAEQAAIDAAEAGVRAVMDQWDSARLTRLPARGDSTIVGSAETMNAVDYVVSIGRSGPAQFTITSTGAARAVDRATYCTVVVRTRLRSGRLAERGAAVGRTCHEAL